NSHKESNHEGGHMAIWRRCSKHTCANPRRCLEHLYFDVTFRGTRYRLPVNEFAIPRMDPNKQRPIQSLEEARDWSACSSARSKPDAMRVDRGSYASPRTRHRRTSRASSTRTSNGA